MGVDLPPVYIAVVACLPSLPECINKIKKLIETMLPSKLGYFWTCNKFGNRSFVISIGKSEIGLLHTPHSNLGCLCHDLVGKS